MYNSFFDGQGFAEHKSESFGLLVNMLITLDPLGTCIFGLNFVNLSMYFNIV